MKKAATPRHYLTLNIGKLLAFYDEPNQEKKDPTGSSVSALTALIGEDLVLGALDHYFRQRIQKPIDYSCRGWMRVVSRKGSKPKRSNSWLDAWIVLPGKCFQTEVKNWSASAVGGQAVSRAGLIAAAHHNMRLYLGSKRNTRMVWKVVKEMRDPPSKTILPMLAFWSPIAPLSTRQESDLNPLFRQNLKPYLRQMRTAKIKSAGFKSVMVFSASIYLRHLKKRRQKTVRLYMPRAAQRLSLLRDMGLKL
jgi:hypothetical protein